MPDQPPERRTAHLTLNAAVGIAYALSRAADDDDDDDDDRARLARDLDIVLARVDFDTDYGASADSVTVGIILTNAERDLIRGAMTKYLPVSALMTHVEDALAKASR